MTGQKRRLPVLQSDGGAGGDEPSRSRAHWVGFGALMIVTAWLPLAYAGEALKARVFAGELPRGGGYVLFLALSAVPLALASFAGGFLVGRFGKPAGTREAALAGLATGLAVAALTWGLAWREGGEIAWGAALVPLALFVPMAALGGAAGAPRR